MINYTEKRGGLTINEYIDAIAESAKSYCGEHDIEHPGDIADAIRLVAEVVDIFLHVRMAKLP